MALNKSTNLIIGVGNPYRSDDKAGLVVARRLAAAAGRDIRVIEASGEGAALMEAWQGASRVIIIDAARSGALPGTIHRLDAHAQKMPESFLHCSTHAFGVSEAIEMARALGQLPPSLIVYAIEGRTIEPGERLSFEVGESVSRVASLVMREFPDGAHSL